MKVILITDIEINGVKKEAGKELDVSNLFGRELIQSKKAIDKENKIKYKPFKYKKK
jgi:hypothetical protein